MQDLEQPELFFLGQEGGRKGNGLTDKQVSGSEKARTSEASPKAAEGSGCAAASSSCSALQTGAFCHRSPSSRTGHLRCVPCHTELDLQAQVSESIKMQQFPHPLGFPPAITGRNLDLTRALSSESPVWSHHGQAWLGGPREDALACEHGICPHLCWLVLSWAGLPGGEEKSRLQLKLFFLVTGQ